MEHINFKEKFTKNVYRQTASIFKLWDGEGGGQKKTYTTSIPFLILYILLFLNSSAKKKFGRNRKAID